MKTFITKRFTFEAAHMLPNYSGKCKNLHGHSYVLEISLTGPIQRGGSEDGMIMDFAHISEIVNREVIDQWDHRYLNDLLSFSTTAEQLAQEIFKRLAAAGLPLSKLVLWETAKNSATVEA